MRDQITLTKDMITIDKNRRVKYKYEDGVIGETAVLTRSEDHVCNIVVEEEEYAHVDIPDNMPENVATNIVLDCLQKYGEVTFEACDETTNAIEDDLDIDFDEL